MVRTSFVRCGGVCWGAVFYDVVRFLTVCCGVMGYGVLCCDSDTVCCVAVGCGVVGSGVVRCVVLCRSLVCCNVV